MEKLLTVQKLVDVYVAFTKLPGEISDIFKANIEIFWIFLLNNNFFWNEVNILL